MNFDPRGALGRTWALVVDTLRRNGRVVVPIAVAVILVGAVIKAVTGSAATHLPAPQTITVVGSSHSGRSTNQDQLGYTKVQPALLTGCSVQLSNPNPLQGNTSEVATVVSAPDAEVRLEADYARTRSVHTSQAGTDGLAAFALPISHAVPGVAVDITATVSSGSVRVSCTNAFVPVALPKPSNPLVALPTDFLGVPAAPAPPKHQKASPAAATPPPAPPQIAIVPTSPPPGVTGTTTTTTSPPPPTTTTSSLLPPPMTTTTTNPPPTTTTTTNPPPTTTTTSLPPPPPPTTTTTSPPPPPPTTTTTTLLVVPPTTTTLL